MLKVDLSLDLFFVDFSFNPAQAGRALILRSLLRNNDFHFIPRELAGRGLILITLLCRS